MAITLNIELDGTRIPVTVIRKKQNRRMYLRVKDGHPVVTCPAHCTEREITAFVQREEGWIREQLRKQAVRQAPLSADTVRWLGRTLAVRMEQAQKEHMMLDGDTVVFYLKEDTAERRELVFRKYAAKQLEMLIGEYRKEWDTEICTKRGIARPVIRLRNMKSRWGSCQPRKGEIHMSLQLIHYPAECTNAVLLHEYAHLVVANHSSAFYDVVLGCMPYYKEVMKQLKTP